MAAVRLKLNEWRGQFNKNKREIGCLVVIVLIITSMTKVNEYNNQGIVEENKELQDVMLKDRQQIEMMYYIMLRQADSINIYKTYLIRCQDKQIQTFK
jgi:PhoPQ-activated pathogenicity-related protein